MGKARGLQVQCSLERVPHSYTPAMPENIKLQWMGVTNTLAYHDTELIMTAKSFIAQDPSDNIT